MPLVSQCAEITIIAEGLGIFWVALNKSRVNLLSAIAFMGEPCPIKKAGINGEAGIALSSFNNEFALIIIMGKAEINSRLFI